MHPLSAFFVTWQVGRQFDKNQSATKFVALSGMHSAENKRVEGKMASASMDTLLGWALSAGNSAGNKRLKAIGDDVADPEAEEDNGTSDSDESAGEGDGMAVTLLAAAAKKKAGSGSSAPKAKKPAPASAPMLPPMLPADSRKKLGVGILQAKEDIVRETRARRASSCQFPCR